MSGLNEGSWPGLPAPDPFLAPAIRRALSLPGLARRTGQEAQQFAGGLGAPDVLLTRSLRAGGAPTVASRFWQRLAAATGGLADSGALSPGREALLEAARALGRPPAAAPYPRPEPQPPVSARPQEITVTDVAMLKADPFTFYARRILKLSKLDPRDAEPTAGERGQVVHDILQRALQEGQATLPAILDAELRKLGERPEIAALWRPRVERMVGWALATMAEQPDWQPFRWEEKAELALGPVTLKGRIDRLDRSGSALRVVDYKTGSVPKIKDVTALYQTQLALLAHLAEAGLFGDTGGLPVEALEYWKLSGGLEPGRQSPALGQKVGADDIRAHIEAAWADFEELVGGYLLGERPFRAKQHMVYGRRFSDYDQLARVAEWLGR
nr:PD-(D/E)XK nuclease family protein [Sandaracinobacteroides sayramensis]